MDSTNTKLSAARKKLEERLHRADGFLGTGTGEVAPGKPCILVYWEKARSGSSSYVPNELDGFSIRLVESGRIRPL